MKTKQVSNYDRVLENWRLRFLEMDQEALIEKFGLRADGEALYLTYFSHEMRIDRRTGFVSDTSHPGKPPGFNTRVTIYNVFHYAADAPQASGILVPFREVKRVYPFERAYQATILDALQAEFSGKAPQMDAACRKLGGKPMPQGDVGYILPVFPFLTIAVLFWDADEEFAAQANMLFDSNITDFMHEENVVGIAADALYYLKEAAGLDAKSVYG